MIDRIAQVSIPTRDLPRAISFYRDVLGLPFLFEAPPNLAFFDCGGVRVLLGEGQTAAPNSGTIIYFHAPDIRVAVDRIGTGGGTIEREPVLIARLADRDVWLAVFRDPDGNTLELMSEISHQGAANA